MSEDPGQVMTTCDSCGAQAPSDAAFCPDCGRATASRQPVVQAVVAASASVACPACGAVMPIDGTFCPDCGQALASPTIARSAGPVRIPRPALAVAVIAVAVAVVAGTLFVSSGGTGGTGVGTSKSTPGSTPGVVSGSRASGAASNAPAAATPGAAAVSVTSARWVDAGSMTKARFSFQLLPVGGGRLLAIGDHWNECSECSDTGPDNGSTFADIWDPAAGAWAPTPALAKNRSNYAALVMQDGRVIIAGGYADGSDHCFSSAHIYDPSTQTWSDPKDYMTKARCDPAYALLPNGLVLLAGGTNVAGQVLMSTEKYNPATGKWSTTTTLPAARTGAKAVTLANGKVLLVGGRDTNGNLMSSAIMFDPSSYTWSAAGNPGTGLLVALQDGGALLIPEGYGNALPAERFDFATRTWTGVGALAQARVGASAVTLADGRVLVTGGAIGSTISDVDRSKTTTLTSASEIFDPATNAWSPTVPAPDARMDSAAALMNDGSVMIAGGDLGEQGLLAFPGGYQTQLVSTSFRYVP